MKNKKELRATNIYYWDDAGKLKIQIDFDNKSSILYSGTNEDLKKMEEKYGIKAKKVK